MNRWILLLCLVVSACSFERSTPVRLAHPWVGERAVALQKAIEAYQNEGGALKIKLEYVKESDFDSWLLGEFAMAKAPELFISPSMGLVHQLTEAGKIQALNSEWQSWKDQNYYSSSWEEVVVGDSSVYAVPVVENVEALIQYSVSELEALQLKLPLDFNELTRQISSSKGEIRRTGSDIDFYTKAFEQIFIRRLGTQSYRQLLKSEFDWSSKSARNFVSEFKAFLKATSNMEEDARGTAFLYYGPLKVEESKQDFYILPDFKDSEPTALILSADYLAASLSESISKEKLLDFFEYMVRPASQTLLLSETYGISANKHLDDSIYKNTLTQKESRMALQAGLRVHSLVEQMSISDRRNLQKEISSFVTHQDSKRFLNSMALIFKTKN